MVKQWQNVNGLLIRRRDVELVVPGGVDAFKAVFGDTPKRNIVDNGKDDIVLSVGSDKELVDELLFFKCCGWLKAIKPGLLRIEIERT